MTLTHGGLFEGIGGFSLGLELAGGFDTRWMAELDPYRRKVLAHRFPGARVLRDVHHVSAAACEPVNVLSGGFPCQDLSDAGHRAGIVGARSGLWHEFARVIGEFRPSWVLIENVPSLRKRGLATVLRDLAALRFDAEWTVLAAAHVGAPHLRERLWIVAWPADTHQDRRQHERDAQEDDQGAPRPRPGTPGERGSARGPRPRGLPHRAPAEPRIFDARFSADVAYAKSFGQAPDRRGGVRHVPPDRSAEDQGARRVPPSGGLRDGGGRRPTSWQAEPDVGRVADGVPAGLDRLAALGDSLVPAIVTIIGRAIMRAEGLTTTEGTA